MWHSARLPHNCCRVEKPKLCCMHFGATKFDYVDYDDKVPVGSQRGESGTVLTWPANDLPATLNGNLPFSTAPRNSQNCWRRGVAGLRATTGGCLFKLSVDKHAKGPLKRAMPMEMATGPGTLLMSVTFGLWPKLASSSRFFFCSCCCWSLFSGVVVGLLSSGQFQLNIRCHCCCCCCCCCWFISSSCRIEAGCQDASTPGCLPGMSAGTASSCRCHIKAEAVCLCKCLHMSLAPHPVTHVPCPAHSQQPRAKQCLSCCACVCVVCVCVWLWPSPEVAIFVFLLSSFAYNGAVKVHKMSMQSTAGSDPVACIACNAFDWRQEFNKPNYACDLIL